MFKPLYRFGSYIIAFILPCILLCGVFVIWRVYPFGDRSVLMSDEFTQYLPFYNHFYDVLKGKGSLLYSWESGMGLNFWGTFAYYLASPLSFIVILFKRSNLPEAIMVMILIKVGLSGLFMNIYLTKQFRSEKITKLIFATLYGLISFSIGYFFNIMWLDSVYMLPLVLLGVEYLFQKKFFFLIISLSILFISNFYMAYITGIFTFLYFLMRSFSKNCSIKLFFKNLASFLLCTLAAVGISAFVTLPTYILLKSNDQPLDWTDALHPGFGFFEFLAKLYNGSLNLLFLPNVFCGLLSLLLAPLFFISSKIEAREKLIHFLLLVVLLLSFQINGLNYIWHAFEKPTGYLDRFAFVFSFFLIYLAFRAYIVFEKKYLSSLAKVYLCNVFLLMLLTKFEPDLISVKKALLNIGILTTFMLTLYAKEASQKHQHFFTIMLLFFACLDMGINAYSQIKTLNSYQGYSFTRSQYNLQKPSFEQLVTELNEQDKVFYRLGTNMSTASQESLQYRHFTGDVPIDVNDSLRYRYKGMSNFNTLSNGPLHQFLNALGYSSTLGSRSLTQNNGIILSDSLFGFKYLLTDEPINKVGYEKVECKEDVCLYRNKNALPIGFMMNGQQVVFPLEDNPFEKQNQLIGPADTKKEYFSPVNVRTVHYNNLEVNNEGNMLYVKKIDSQQEGSIEMTFDLGEKKQFYTLLSTGNGFNKTTIYVNGKPLGLYPTYHNDRVLDLGAFSNETVTIKIVFLEPKSQLVQKEFYALDLSSFEQRIKELKAESLNVTEWTSTSIKGNIQAKSTNTLFLSIPYDIGWHAQVDGVTVPVKKLGGFIGVHLQKGTHNVQVDYRVPGFKEGTLVTAFSIIVVTAFFFYLKRKEKRTNGRILF
jgi:uncharacterized membrane protein YfhO